MLAKATSAKPHYTETEAAQALGIEVAELRRLIQLHIVTTDEDAAFVPMTLFQPADLLLLRLLVQKQKVPFNC